MHISDGVTNFTFKENSTDFKTIHLKQEKDDFSIDCADTTNAGPQKKNKIQLNNTSFLPFILCFHCNKSLRSEIFIIYSFQSSKIFYLKVILYTNSHKTVPEQKMILFRNCSYISSVPVLLHKSINFRSDIYPPLP